mmetsp:Transcript_36966/g.75418  ORF Transcript_36966/g.75418 Transcript_36966/m.75418 type:complete len:221 (-) Transcript_36966:278-940(-)
MSLRIPNFEMTIAQSEGVGEKREQLMTRTSISLGDTLAFFKAFSTMSKMTVSASLRLPSMVLSVFIPLRHCTMPGGHAVLCPVPDLTSSRRMNSRLSSVKHSCLRIISTICSCDTFHESGALNVANERRYTGLSMRISHPTTTRTTNVASTAGEKRDSPRKRTRRSYTPTNRSFTARATAMTVLREKQFSEPACSNSSVATWWTMRPKRAIIPTTNNCGA